LRRVITVAKEECSLLSVGGKRRKIKKGGESRLKLGLKTRKNLYSGGQKKRKEEAALPSSAASRGKKRQ